MSVRQTGLLNRFHSARRIGAAMLLAGGFVCMMPVADGNAAEVSKRQREINNKIYNLAQPFLLDNKSVDSRIEELIVKLRGVAPFAVDDNVQARVFHHTTPLAFSIGPGDVYLSTALLDNLTDEAELAVVLARELNQLQEPERASQIQGRKKRTASGLFYGGITLGIVLVFKSTFDRVAESGLGASSGGTMTENLLIAAALAPYGIMQMTHNSKLKRSHMALPFRMGRLLNSEIATAEGTFDAVLMSKLHYGDKPDIELAADRAAFAMTTELGYRADALVTFLENSAAINTLELSRLKQASPGLEVRLSEAETELEVYRNEN